MNLVKIIILVLILGFGNFKILYAENHDTTKESTETTSETETEEDVPLNDPFAGNAGLSETLDLDNTTNKTETRSILYDYKLVGVISGSLQSYVSLVDAGGQVITLEMFEELSVGLQLVDMNHREAVFQRSDGKYLIINFKNQIVERDDHAKK
jgi:hypothetical protein|tara:strand:- start:1552 stop:2010 length:459 start_codon:yes stop_codon:yes gene_type:complete